MSPVAKNEVRIAVAEIGLVLRGDGPHHTVLCGDRYQPFLTAEVSPSATVDVTTAEVNLDGVFTGLEVALERQTLHYRAYGAEGHLDASTGAGWLRITTDVDIASSALANFLRVTYALLLIRHGGFLFHSAGMIRNGYGYLFYGRSGSGKTTVSRLSQNHVTLLSDDLVAVRALDAVWWIYGTPFWGELRDHPKTNASAPLRGLFSLVKAPEVSLEPLPRAVAVADVISSVPVTSTEPHTSVQLVALCENLVAQVPCYRLYFLPDSSLWSVIDELA